MRQRFDFIQINKAYSSVVNDIKYKSTYSKPDPQLTLRYQQLSSSYTKIDKEWLDSYMKSSLNASKGDQSSDKHNNPAFLPISSLRSQLKLSQTEEPPSIDETLDMLRSRDLA